MQRHHAVAVEVVGAEAALELVVPVLESTVHFQVFQGQGLPWTNVAREYLFGFELVGGLQVLLQVVVVHYLGDWRRTVRQRALAESQKLLLLNIGKYTKLSSR